MAAVALALTAAAVLTGAAFTLGRITSPHRPRPGTIDLHRVAAAVLELQHHANRQAAELHRQQADLDSLFSIRHHRYPPALDRAARRRQAAIDATGRTAQNLVVRA